MNEHIITINGKSYNAETGVLVSPHAAEIITNIDQPKIASPKLASKSRAIKKIIHHKPQPTNTLKRELVKQPDMQDILPRVENSEGQNTFSSSKHILHTKVHSNRQKRAITAKRSSAIQKFGPKSSSDIQVKHASIPLAVQKAMSASVPANNKDYYQDNDDDSIFDKAIESSTHHQSIHGYDSHKKSLRQKLSSFSAAQKTTSLLSTGLAIVLLIVFFSYQNVPNVALRVAAARSGVSAQMPNYTASGYGFKGPISYGSGQVTINFVANGDDRSYTLTQRSTNWDSDALKSNFVTLGSTPYQTIADKGRTIFIFGTSAAWVDGGVWYNLEGSALSTDQVLRIASSIK